MQKSALYFAILVLTAYPLLMKAQHTLPVTGGAAEGNNGSLNYTIGQLSVQTASGPDASIKTGIQQVYEISSDAGMDNALDENLTLSIFPNPTPEYLILNVDTFSVDPLWYRLYDQQGNLLDVEKIKDIQTRIKFMHLPRASYFLKVLQNTRVIKIFKIVKH